MLLATLKRDDCRLGRLVSDTLCIDYWLDALEKHLEDAFGEDDVGDQSKRWYTGVLASCPHLRSVNLQFPNASNLHDLLRSLGLIRTILPIPSPPPPTTRLSFNRNTSIRNVVFGEDWRFSLWANNVDILSLILDFLSASHLPSLRSLSFHHLSFDRRNELERKPSQLCYPITHLYIKAYRGRIPDYFPFFPRDRYAFKHLEYDGRGSPDGQDFIALKNVVNPHLQVLFFSFIGDPAPVDITLSNYFSRRNSPSLPLEAFNSYPHLTILALNCCHGPSLELLETLLRSSPLLSRLAFASSRWVSDSTPLSNDPDEVFPENEILEVLLKFRQLRYLSLGVLPTTDPHRYDEFQDRILESGMSFSYAICEK